MLPKRTIALPVLLGCLYWAAGWPSPAPAALPVADPDSVFAAFTGHIRQQIQSDKAGFAQAQTCTEWFYRQQHKQPAQPHTLGVAFRPIHSADRRLVQTSDCPSRYPGGLDAARQDFSLTQSALSLSLTFYEFALVGDGNDDGRYSPRELQDILESCGLLFHPGAASAAQAALLNAKFDAIRKAGELDRLMASMGILYDKGYRFTAPDRADLNRVSG